MIAKEEDKNLRVDVFINKLEKDLSRTRVKNLILNQKLTLNGNVIINPSKKITIGDILKLAIPEPKKLH